MSLPTTRRRLGSVVIGAGPGFLRRSGLFQHPSRVSKKVLLANYLHHDIRPARHLLRVRDPFGDVYAGQVRLELLPVRIPRRGCPACGACPPAMGLPNGRAALPAAGAAAGRADARCLGSRSARESAFEAVLGEHGIHPRRRSDLAPYALQVSRCLPKLALQLTIALGSGTRR